MKKVHWMSFILLILVFSMMVCKQTQVTSVWLDKPLEIDGKRNELGQAGHFSKTNELSLSFQNNDTLLYLSLMGPRSKNFNLLMTGFTLWMENMANEKIGIRIPGKQTDQRNPGEDPMMMDPRFGTPEEPPISIQQIEIIQKDNQILRLINLYENRSDDVQFAVGLDHNMMVIELGIPFNLSFTLGKLFKISAGEKVRLKFESTQIAIGERPGGMGNPEMGGPVDGGLGGPGGVGFDGRGGGRLGDPGGSGPAGSSAHSGYSGPKFSIELLLANNPL